MCIGILRLEERPYPLVVILVPSVESLFRIDSMLLMSSITYFFITVKPLKFSNQPSVFFVIPSILS